MRQVEKFPMSTASSPILIGIGANLPNPGFATPRDTCEAAVQALMEEGVKIASRSRWYKSAPVPVSSQPWFVNGLVAVETALSPAELLAVLKRVENQFGRTRSIKNAARTLDLDIIAYGDTIIGWDEEGADRFCVPHPRLHKRAFVLFPLKDIAPHWRHPAMQLTLGEMIDGLDPAQQTEPDVPEG